MSSKPVSGEPQPTTPVSRSSPAQLPPNSRNVVVKGSLHNEGSYAKRKLWKAGSGQLQNDPVDALRLLADLLDEPS